MLKIITIQLLIKVYLIALLFMMPLNLHANERTNWLVQTNEVNDVQLFEPSFGENEPSKKPFYEGDHRYLAKLNLNAKAKLIEVVEKLFKNNSERIIWGHRKSRYTNFLYLEKVKLGIDINFKQGVLLSKDNRITSISHDQVTGFGTQNPVYKYTISFQNNDFREHQIQIGEDEFSLLVYHDTTRFYASGINSSSELWVNVIDFTTPKTNIPRRGNDIVNWHEIVASKKAKFNKLLAIERREIKPDVPLKAQVMSLINEAKKRNRENKKHSIK
ncbi:hypothetical protein [Aliikangiella sp. IMCC44359]|uniref:hypothetical protein n=1 Tax=Aliikangiella sp. IMCC44359 TaxID=3459125 RepID=UPI00403B37A6